MKKIIEGFVTIALLVGIIICLNILIKKSVAGYEKDEQKYKSALGSKVVIQKDTLLVIDYSMWNETLTLSDGSKIAYTFYTKIK